MTGELSCLARNAGLGRQGKKVSTARLRHRRSRLQPPSGQIHPSERPFGALGSTTVITESMAARLHQGDGKRLQRWDRCAIQATISAENLSPTPQASGDDVPSTPPSGGRAIGVGRAKRFGEGRVIPSASLAIRPSPPMPALATRKTSFGSGPAPGRAAATTKVMPGHACARLAGRGFPPLMSREDRAAAPPR